MSDAIQEQIIKKVAGALAEITIANGFENTIVTVQRYRASGMDLGQMPTVLVKEGDCVTELVKSTHQRIRRRMELFLVIATRQDEETDIRSGGELLNSLVADIEKQLAAHQTWDDLALFTDPPSYLEMEIDAVTPHLARGLRVEVVYEHVRDNPWAQ